MICSQKRLHELSTNKKLSNKEREEVITLIRAGGYDMPDCMFENAYRSFLANPSSDQSTWESIQSIYR